MSKYIWCPIQKEDFTTKNRIRVPWAVAEKAYKVYSARFGTSQSLERLAERGGFGLVELIVLLADEPFDNCSNWLSNNRGVFKDE